MSIIKVDKIEKRTGSTLTLGGACTAVTLASGATQTGFGRTGTVDWCTTAKTSPFTAVSGDGFFVNTSGGGITVTLPSSPSAGDIVAFKDYAGTFDCSAKALSICRNGSKINGNCANTVFSTQGQSVTLIYVDGTKGWQDIHDSTSDVTGQAYISATGGTVTNSPCGDFKVHTFNSTSTFVVSDAGNEFGSNTIEYLVVAGGGGGGADGGAGGGAGGTRYNFPSPRSAGLPVTAPTTFPVTVGAGGAGANEPGNGTQGSSTVFAGTTPITSAGGGGGSGKTACSGGDGGSGGGGRKGPGSAAGTGNTPSVSPPQGNNGGVGAPPSSPKQYTSGGGGGACNAGTAGANAPGPTTEQFATGGDGKSFPTATWGSSGDTQPTGQFFGGGGGSGQGSSSGSGNTPYDTPLGNGGKGGGGAGGDSPGPGSPDAQVHGRAGTANTGGGGGGASEQCAPSGRDGGAGGSGVTIIRYRFQN
jgi:hypothetical protein